MSKKDNKDVKNSTKCWIFDNDCDQYDVKVRYYCHITGGCIINLKWNHKIRIVFCKLL